MGTTNSKSMFDRLPEDVIQVILRDLPVKTLCRCITVSKYFASIISSFSFIYSLLCSASPSSLVPSDPNDGSDVFVECNPSDFFCPTSDFGLNIAGIDKLKVAGALVPMTRRGNGSKGQRIQLLSNHFKVGVSSTDGHFFHYSVSLFYEDGRPVEAEGIGRRVIEKLHETYQSDLAWKDFAYDGEKSLFTIGACEYLESIYFRDEGWDCRIRRIEPLTCSFD